MDGYPVCVPYALLVYHDLLGLDARFQPRFVKRYAHLEGTVTDAPSGPFDAATCILVLGLLADDGAKLAANQSRLKTQFLHPFEHVTDLRFGNIGAKNDNHDSASHGL